jgi:hypothetical protein
MAPVECSRSFDTLLTVNEAAWALFSSNPKNQLKKINMGPPQLITFLQNLAHYKVEYILIGGFAMSFHGLTRATEDIDLWVRSTPGNMEKLRESLINSGFDEAKALRKTTQLVAGMSVFTFEGSDFSIDLMHRLNHWSEDAFDQCFDAANRAVYHGIEIRVLDAHSLLAEKESLRRNKVTDQMDIEHLRRIIEKGTL